jgi:hypothetical protein
MFVSVFVVMMGFRRSVRMGSGVHAKKNLPHQLLKDKGRLQSVKLQIVMPTSTARGTRFLQSTVNGGTCFCMSQTRGSASLRGTRDDGFDGFG